MGVCNIYRFKVSTDGTHTIFFTLYVVQMPVFLSQQSLAKSVSKHLLKVITFFCVVITL